MRPVAYPTSWQRVPLISLCEVHVDCVNRTAKTVDAVTPFKMIRTTNVRNGFIDTENVRYVDESTYKRWVRRLVPKRGDVILTREAPLGEVGMVRTEETIFLGQRLYHFRADRNKLDHNFLLYALLATDLQGQVRGFGSGATVEHMRLGDIPRLEITVPSLPIQQRIGTILASYDDLIENNTRRIQVLERMAQALYREWFVNFRFPAHAKIKLVASPLGTIPQGWNVVRLDELYATASGGTPSRKVPEYYGGETNWVKTQELRDCYIFETDEKISAAGLENSSAKVFPANTVLVAMYGATIGQLGILAQPAATNQACCAVLTKVPGFNHAYAYLTLLTRRSDLVNLRQGAAQQNVSQIVIRGFPMLKPPSEVMAAFNASVAPKLELIRNLQRKNQVLRHSRDLLLPRLLSGLVDVSKFTDE